MLETKDHDIDRDLDSNLDKDKMNEVLFHFLESIYLFEKREMDHFDINWDEIYLLQLVKRNPGQKMVDLSEMMKVKPFVMSRMITRLERAKLLKRMTSLQDKRVTHIHLTDTGLAKIQEIELYNYETLRKQLLTYSPEELSVIMRTLKNLNTILGL